VNTLLGDNPDSGALLLGGRSRARGGFSALAQAIGGATQSARERSPFKSASAQVGSAASGARDVRTPNKPGRGESR
jgi:hypothetical protein